MPGRNLCAYPTTPATRLAGVAFVTSLLHFDFHAAFNQQLQDIRHVLGIGFARDMAAHATGANGSWEIHNVRQCCTHPTTFPPHCNVV
mmetsp:Transcript_1842/g.3232  ORF Transcript_1842/g.3232 Transcript_1842/m.3232 type:complete len:88 (+) Transcript_1842:239-502(+)